MAISEKVKNFLEKASWIRKMFEQGAMLKNKYGEENVFDFSLGNPNLEPPEQFFDALESFVNRRTPKRHAYMPNAGYPETRQSLARQISIEQGVKLSGDHVVMACGAGGGLNVVLKTILDPGDEVIVPAPYFVEYNFYIDNHGGTCRTVKTDETFSLDLDEIEKSISERTKALLINTPNNPTGRLYDENTIRELGRLLERTSAKLGRRIYLISDEPYRNIVYDGVKVPGIMKEYRNSIVINSYSKDLSIPGERIGYIAVNPELEPLHDMLNGIVFATRTLGFVNAPALMQNVVKSVQAVKVDVEKYKRKRDSLCSALSEMGYSFIKPEGAFYLFPQTPVDDVRFVAELQEERILVVPGSGFGMPGFFRIAYCVDDRVIENSLFGFETVAKKYF